MKYKLREFFSIEKDGEVIVGPCDIELTDEQFAAESHKVEAMQEVQKKKPKAEDK